MTVFYEIADIKSGNGDVNNFLPVKCNKRRSITSINYEQSISHNVVKRGLMSVIDVLAAPACVMQICITGNDEMSSLSRAANHKLL
jgi:hypothetical protein